MSKRITAILLAVIFSFGGIFCTPAFASGDDEYDAVEVAKIMNETSLNALKAKSAILVDAGTGGILFRMNENEKMPMASITKIMTMLIIMESVENGRIGMQEKVQVSENAMSYGGSQVYLEAGEEFTLEEMLKAIAIHSANDASVAVAEKIAGSEEAFVQMMNEKAEKLNMKNTYFVDCSGLTDVGHYSSAKDVAIMSRELITKHPAVLQYTSMWNSPFRDMELYNRNKLVRFYDGADGLKTGFTNIAGHCISATALRNGLHLIAVIMGGPDSNTRFAEARKLLDHGFANYESAAMETKGTIVKEAAVKKGMKSYINAIVSKDVTLLLKKGDKTKVTETVQINEELTAPIEKGQKIGEILYMIEGVKNPVGKVDLVSDCEVPKCTVFKLFTIMLCKWFCLGRS